MSTEEWKSIPTHPKYEISTLGRVRGIRTPSLRQFRNAAGYMLVGLYTKSARSVKVYAVHRLVLMTFVGLREDGQVCRHLNGDPSDNRLVNLRWGTYQENADDRERHGRGPKGERNPKAVITEEGVREIRRRYAAGEPSRVIAADFGITRDHATQIAKGLWWRNIA